MARRGWLLAMGLTCVACSSSSNGGAPSPDAGGSTPSDASTNDDATTVPDAGGPTSTQTIGLGGGTVSAGGVTLTFPIGALAGQTVVSVTTSDLHVPAGYTALSPVFA